MEIKLNELNLENFKGIKRFYFKPDGENATIRGTNATGKTTVADAFRWLVFGKDTQNNANFQLKTVSPDGQAVSNLDHTVNGIIEIDGTPIELKKVFKEKWTKRRGEAQRTLTGHTTNHFIDGVPVQQKKWDSMLNDFIDEELFKLVTLPSYFNDLHWQKRREILLSVCGDVDDIDVISSDKALEAIPGIIGGRSLEDHRKVVKAEQREINDRLKELPARIDELHKSLPEASNRKAIEAYIRHIDAKIERAKDDSEISSFRKDLADARAYLAELQTEDLRAQRELNQKTEVKIEEVKREIRRLTSEISNLKTDNDTLRYTLSKNYEIMSGLRTKFTEIAAQEQQYDEICPTCNQPLPLDQIEAAKAKFRENQARELTEINDRGKNLKRENETNMDCVKDAENKIKDLESDIKSYEESLPEITQELKDPKQNEKIPEVLEEIIKLEAAIKDHPTPDITGLENERREEQKKLAILDAAETIHLRIRGLKEEEKGLSKKYEELEAQIFLMEQFMVAKVNLLEDNINSKFALARFKLFDVQINKGIKETCITTVNGVPYGAGLNKGMEHNADLDILKTLSDYYDLYPPVWEDNIEAVVAPLEIPHQRFKLKVADLWKCKNKHIFARHEEIIEGKKILVPSQCPECESREIEKHNEMQVLID